MLIPIGVGIAGEVEPVPCPVLAVLRRREQLFDLSSVCLVRRSSEKVLDLLGRRRKPGHVEV